MFHMASNLEVDHSPESISNRISIMFASKTLLSLELHIDISLIFKRGVSSKFTSDKAMRSISAQPEKIGRISNFFVIP